MCFSAHFEGTGAAWPLGPGRQQPSCAASLLACAPEQLVLGTGPMADPSEGGSGLSAGCQEFPSMLRKGCQSWLGPLPSWGRWLCHSCLLILNTAFSSSPKPTVRVHCCPEPRVSAGAVCAWRDGEAGLPTGSSKAGTHETSHRERGHFCTMLSQQVRKRTSVALLRWRRNSAGDDEETKPSVDAGMATETL